MHVSVDAGNPFLWLVVILCVLVGLVVVTMVVAGLAVWFTSAGTVRVGRWAWARRPGHD